MGTVGSGYRCVLEGRTHIGRKRVNQDAFLVNEDLGLAVVCDGISTGDHGEVAAALGARFIETFLTLAREIRPRLERPLKRAVEAADLSLRAFRGDVLRRRASGNDLWWDFARSGLELKECRSTVVALCDIGAGLSVSWAGDSRCYRLQGDRLIALTEDDADRGGSAVNSALGGLRGGYANERTLSGIREGDVFLLCSDGLYKRDSDDLDRSAGIVAEVAWGLRNIDGPDPDVRRGRARELLRDGCRRLIDEAHPENDRPTKDNLTVVLVWIESVPEAVDQVPVPEAAGLDDPTDPGERKLPPRPVAEDRSNVAPLPVRQPTGRGPGGLLWPIVGVTVVLLAALGLWSWFGRARSGPSPEEVSRRLVEEQVGKGRFDRECARLIRDARHDSGWKQTVADECAVRFLQQVFIDDEGSVRTEPVWTMFEEPRNSEVRRYSLDRWEELKGPRPSESSTAPSEGEGGDDTVEADPLRDLDLVKILCERMKSQVKENPGETKVIGEFLLGLSGDARRGRVEETFDRVCPEGESISEWRGWP